MAIISTLDPKTITIRFIRGCCYEGVDYGPEHLDRPVTMPTNKARGYLENSKARIYVPEVFVPEEPGEVLTDSAPPEILMVPEPEEIPSSLVTPPKPPVQKRLKRGKGKG